MVETTRTQHDWTVHAINIHGVFFERWCQGVLTESPGWSVDSVNYPVEFPMPNGPLRGRESSLDIRASRDVGDAKICLLVECKKNNPEFVDWVFFEKPAARSSREFFVSQVENSQRSAPAQGWDTSFTLRGLSSSDYVVADEARETRVNYLEYKASKKTKTSNAAIQDAALQVSLAKQAVSHEDNMISREMGNSPVALALPWQKKIYVPIIVTTAHLHICTFDNGDIDPATGEIDPKRASIKKCDELIFEYALPRHLQAQPKNLSAAYKEGLVDLFTRQHILVVHRQQFPKFLRTFYEGSDPKSSS